MCISSLVKRGILKKKILITVKTYPHIDAFEESVCTAGIAESGEWVRIYPIPFRSLNDPKRYKKYQWIELELKKSKKDSRAESFSPVNMEKVHLGEVLGTDGGSWKRRKETVLKKVYTKIGDLTCRSERKNLSLAVFKPTKIKNFYVEQVSRDWPKEKVEEFRNQFRLFSNQKNPFESLKKLPYKFYYEFEDSVGTVSKLSIIDWELGALFWKQLESKGNEEKALDDVKKKYFDDFTKNKDLYFFLGTTKRNHFTARNPYMIIGVFYPKKESYVGDLFERGV